jgi:hypothetical protein
MPSGRLVLWPRHDVAVANGDSRGTEVLKALGLVVGLLAGIVGLLYAIGGGVLTLRLYLEDLPSLTVVGQLPREFLISIALTQIVLPAVAAAGVYLAWRVLFRSSAGPPTNLVRQWRRRGFRSWAELGLVSLLIALVLTLPAAAPALKREGFDKEKLNAAVAIALAATVVVELGALKARATLAERERFTWSTARPRIAMVLVIALAVLPAFVVAAGTFHFLEAKVCVEDRLDAAGVLVGETSAGVYIGDPRGTGEGPRRVVSVPTERVEKLLIGGEAAQTNCA